jgi:hypothetical protein
MVLYEEPVRKLIARDDKPLSDNDAERKTRKSEDHREAEERERRRPQKAPEKQDKDREDGRRL